MAEAGMARGRRVYQPRIFEGRVLMPEEQEQIHKELLEFAQIEAVSDSMRELKLPPKDLHS